MPRITYFLRSNNDAQKSHVLYCRVTYNRTKTEFSLKEKIDLNKWDQKNQTLTSRGSQKKFIDLLLESNSYKIKSAALFGEFQTAKDLVSSLNQSKQKPTMLANIVENYHEESREKVRASTYRTNGSRLKNLLAFEKFTDRKFTTDSFDLAAAQKFIDWFCDRSNTNNVHTASRNIAYYKAAQMNAMRMGRLKSFGLIHYTVVRDAPKPIKFLSLDELETISAWAFHSETLSKVRDLFVFQCATGLSYSDLIGAFDVKITEVGKVIVGDRKKTGQSFFIPLSDSAAHIYLKYNGEIPKYTNAAYNRMLKEIAGICQIDVVLTTHVARKTFATVMDAKGWSRESVARMLGHRSVKTTDQYYIGESNARIIQEMKDKMNAA